MGGVRSVARSVRFQFVQIRSVQFHPVQFHSVRIHSVQFSRGREPPFGMRRPGNSSSTIRTILESSLDAQFS